MGHWEKKGSCSIDEIPVDDIAIFRRNGDGGNVSCGVAAPIGDQIASDQILGGLPVSEDGGASDSGESVAGDIDVAASLDTDAGAHVDLQGILVLEQALLFSVSDVAVGKAVPGDGDPAAVRADSDGELMNKGKGIGGDGATVGVAEIDAALHIMGDDIRAESDAVAVAIQNDGSAVAFFDHVAGEDGTVSVLNDDSVAEMIVDVVSVHAEVEGIEATEGVLVFLKVISIHHDVVPGLNQHAGVLVIGDNGIGDARILVAIDQGNAVAAMMIDGEPVDEDLVDAFGVDPVATFLIAGNPEVPELNAPEPGLGIFGSVRRTQDEGRFAGVIEILDVGRGSRSFDAGLWSGDDEWLRDFESAGRKGDDSPGGRQGVDGCLEAIEL